MTTLLLTHPACLNHLTPPGHPERPDRLRAIERALEDEKFQDAGARSRRRWRRSTSSRSCIRWTTSSRCATATPKEGMVRLDADTTMSPGTFEAVLRAAGGAVCAVDEVMAAAVVERLRRGAPARPSRRDRDADGLLPVQQRRDRGAPRADRARRRARRDRRFRRASRQRHAGDLLGRRDRDVLLDAPDAALSRHRRALRARRARHHRQRAAARRATAASSSARRWRPTILPRLRDFTPDLIIISAGFDAHRRDPLANLNLVEADFALGDAEADGGRRRRPRRAASCRCSKAATISKACRARSPRMSPR